VKHQITGLSLVLAALTLSALTAAPVSAQAQNPAKPDLSAIPAAEVKAMSACVEQRSGPLAARGWYDHPSS
jgi:hypothetical protein